MFFCRILARHETDEALRLLRLRIIYVAGFALLFLAAPFIGEIPFAIWGIGFPIYFIRESFKARKSARSRQLTNAEQNNPKAK